MANLIVSRFEKDSEIWQSLKEAIAKSSGFQSWQQDKNLNTDSHDDLDLQIRSYLRDTLATLAY